MKSLMNSHFCQVDKPNILSSLRKSVSLTFVSFISISRLLVFPWEYETMFLLVKKLFWSEAIWDKLILLLSIKHGFKSAHVLIINS